jgi:enamine deaminase RidA (YjgF/YER057c/UK114 family)
MEQINVNTHGGKIMSKITRSDVNEEWVHSGIVEAGDFVFINYCVGNIGQPVENQINGAIDHLEKRLVSVGLTLDSVVKLDCLFRDIWNIPIMEKVFKERFSGKYPARKSIQTEFAHTGGENGLLFQLDAIAFRE